MSEYVYPCPPGYYGGSAACAGICVFSMVFNENGFSHWNQCCCGCSEGMFCDEPLEGRDFYSLKDAIDLAKDGEVFSTPCTSGVVGSGSYAFDNGEFNKTFGFIRVQSVDNPSIMYGPTRVNLATDTKRIQMGGWVVTFTRLQAPNEGLPQSANAHILPQQIPMANFNIYDDFRTAFVILPESSGLNPYIVTVPESALYPEPPFRYSILLTREWQVTFVRSPISPSMGVQARKPGGCGCS